MYAMCHYFFISLFQSDRKEQTMTMWVAVVDLHHSSSVEIFISESLVCLWEVQML